MPIAARQGGGASAGGLRNEVVARPALSGRNFGLQLCMLLFFLACLARPRHDGIACAITCRHTPGQTKYSVSFSA